MTIRLIAEVTSVVNIGFLGGEVLQASSFQSFGPCLDTHSLYRDYTKIDSTIVNSIFFIL